MYRGWHEQEAGLHLLHHRDAAGQQDVAQPPGDHAVLRLSSCEGAHTILPGLLVPGLAGALQGAHDDGGVGPGGVLEGLPPTGAGHPTAPAMCHNFCTSAADLVLRAWEGLEATHHFTLNDSTSDQTPKCRDV